MSPTRALLAAAAVLAVALAAYWVWRRAESARRGAKSSLYSRLGGIFSIAGVVDDFSDALLRSPLVGVNSPNPALRKWSQRQASARLPGLKFMRTLWVSDVVGGPYHYEGTRPGASRLGLENAHRRLRITPPEFDEVARILEETLKRHGVPAAEVGQVLGAFAAHKAEVTAGSRPV